MPRIMFTISYTVKPEQRETYLGLISELKNHMTTVAGKNYAVFEAKGKRNQYTEVYFFQSEEEFDSLDDNQDERTQDLLSKLESCIDSSGKKYATFTELT